MRALMSQTFVIFMDKNFLIILDFLLLFMARQF